LRRLTVRNLSCPGKIKALCYLFGEGKLWQKRNSDSKTYDKR